MTHFWVSELDRILCGEPPIASTSNTIARAPIVPETERTSSNRRSFQFEQYEVSPFKYHLKLLDEVRAKSTKPRKASDIPPVSGELLGKYLEEIFSKNNAEEERKKIA